MSAPSTSAPLTSPCPAAHVQLMDRMYALQRYFYDITRKYYLFGRDQLIARMPVSTGDRVLEIGCGTGRNLVLLALRHPQAHFYGVDAANVMIDTADKKIMRRALGGQIHFRQGLAEELDGRAWFEVAQFEHIFFSYSLSMIPMWEAALEAAITSLKPAGELWVVDFWDQGGYPGPFAKLLSRWLALFHVHYRPELLSHLRKLQSDNRGSVAIEPIGRRYAYLARFVKAAR
jgi:S-adenosylmethionine-diacylgycerolhomoserine-N-methlytransferase